MSKFPAVGVTHTPDYTIERVCSDVRRHFAFHNIDKQVLNGKRVLIKANLVMKRTPEEATTTHPAVIEAIVRCAQECGAKEVVIADSPGGPFTVGALRGIYASCGMQQAAEHTGAVLNEDVTSFERERQENELVHRFTLIHTIKEADFIIDAVKLKTHGMTMLSGAVKNLFGTIPGLMKPEFHWRFPKKDVFSNMLVDLCETVRPDLVITDAIVCMEGDGPSGGVPKQVGMILSSRSPYEHDLAACALMGLSTDEVFTVSHAIRRGLCSETIDKVSLVGDPLIRCADFLMPKSKSISFSDKIPKVFLPVVDKLLTSKPVIRKKDCVGCGKCAESCPAKTIRIVDRKANIDYSACIRCYCCHEMCPVRAIDIKRMKLFDW
ncbi:DUF362 domain-containing protein [Phocea massiliensis]|uniref:Ferredoxin n=1 Tax=Merdimmobilis hominis TaxID=2897707 RepID=A0A938X534_9FIRM|nr:DUF362 domain-containing protein [Merdimmobilis hominis]